MAQDKLLRIIYGTAPADVDEPEEMPADSVIISGVVNAITPEGMLFQMPDWDGGLHMFGPAPFPQYPVGSQPLPLRGDRCLIVFPAGEPWVIAWWPGGGSSIVTYSDMYSDTYSDSYGGSGGGGSSGHSYGSGYSDTY